LFERKDIENMYNTFRQLKSFVPLTLLFLAAGSGSALFSEDSEKGVTSHVSFGAGSNTLGQIYKLDPSLGYKFNEHFTVSAGIPIYFVHPSTSSTTAGFSSENGLGNAYTALQFAASGSSTYFSSTLRGSAPTGNTEQGFSTGRVTVDWNNYLEGTIGRFTPFGNVAFANTVSDTHFFSRPFSSLGFASQFEGGGTYRVSPLVAVGSSAYVVVPGGDQKVYSKLIRHGNPNTTTGTGNGGGRGQEKKGVFEEASVTAGDSDIAKDHGVSVWLDFLPFTYGSFQVGYSRSMRYAFDTVFFTVGLNPAKLIRRAHQP
jgi:hypothetical protein